MNINTIKIEKYTIHDRHLNLVYSADEFEFSTKIYYHDVSLLSLQERYSPSLIHTLVGHIALFQGMKLCSLFPKHYDISEVAPWISEATLDLFVKIYQGVFGQNWYENNITDYPHPEFVYAQPLGESNPGEILGDRPTVLSGCGGGKDSVVAMKLLEQAGVPFSTLQYSHSIYGKADAQHDLIAKVVEEGAPLAAHRMSLYDDFLDYPLFPLYFPERSGITAPETPTSIFESLLLMLDKGYQYLCLAHEKSANTGNFVWDAIGQEVNHQWGKSLEAETLLDDFIQTHLLSNFKYFSILQPIYDWRIFQNLSQYPEVLSKIHSCNIKKPWCKKCPKCAYVWLGLMAFCQRDIVDGVFQVNLFDDDDLLPIFKAMIGLTEHTPFECIGEIDESRLMMKRCLDHGLSGKALDLFSDQVLSDPQIDWDAIEGKYNTLYREEHAIPDVIFQKIVDKL